MLQHLDTLIAFATVMLGVSLIVTIATQIVLAFFGLRGVNLRWGIRILIANADSELETSAKKIASAVLRHPLISDSTFSRWGKVWERLFGWWRLANAIRKDELLEILTRLTNSGIKGADTTVLKEKVDVVKAHVTSWFDSVMDRVTQRFATHARLATVFISLVVVFILHLDAFDLLQRLSTDGDLRNGLLSQSSMIANSASNILTKAASDKAMPPQGADGNNTNAIAQLQQQFATITNQLSASGLTLSPDRNRHTLRCYWKWAKPASTDALPFTWSHLLGVLAAWAFLSLGAPFWFNSIKTLMNLRPVLATKIEKGPGGAKT